MSTIKPHNRKSSSHSDRTTGVGEPTCRREWTSDEESKFREGLKLYKRDWKAIQELVGSRTKTQIRSHAQKHFLKMKKTGNLEGYLPARKYRERKKTLWIPTANRKELFQDELEEAAAIGIKQINKRSKEVICMGKIFDFISSIFELSNVYKFKFEALNDAEKNIAKMQLQHLAICIIQKKNNTTMELPDISFTLPPPPQIPVENENLSSALYDEQWVSLVTEVNIDPSNHIRQLNDFLLD